MLDILGKVGKEFNEIYKTGSALVAQGCNHLLDTSIGKKISKVTSPVFIWVKDHTPEPLKNKLLVYGTGAVASVCFCRHLWTNRR